MIEQRLSLKSKAILLREQAVTEARTAIMQARSLEKYQKAEAEFIRLMEHSDVSERRQSALDSQGSQLAIASARIGRQQVVMVNPSLKNKCLVQQPLAASRLSNLEQASQAIITS